MPSRGLNRATRATPNGSICTVWATGLPAPCWGGGTYQSREDDEQVWENTGGSPKFPGPVSRFAPRFSSADKS